MNTPSLRAVAALALLGLCSVLGIEYAAAHETPIALLELRELPSGVYEEHWTFQTSRDLATPTAFYPAHCDRDGKFLDCGGRGLDGVIGIEDIGEQYSGAVVKIIRLDGSARSFTLSAAQKSVRLTADGALGVATVAAAYIPLGFEHILLGVDHLLFVLGLIWLVRSPGMLVKTITSFTVAHSITLAAATLGWLGVPERPVNAIIALSIVFVAVELIRHQRGEDGLTVRHPWIVAFGFGLLHGFGFAGALTAIGLPVESIPLALLFFNVGVEVGQLAFVAVVLMLIWAHRTVAAELPRWSQPVPAYAIGSLATYWFIGRFTLMVST